VATYCSIDCKGTSHRNDQYLLQMHDLKSSGFINPFTRNIIFASTTSVHPSTSSFVLMQLYNQTTSSSQHIKHSSHNRLVACVVPDKQWMLSCLGPEAVVNDVYSSPCNLYDKKKTKMKKRLVVVEQNL
jgi:hypothetical protein